MLEGEGLMEAFKQRPKGTEGAGAEQAGLWEELGPEEECVWSVGGTSRGPVCESGYSHVGPSGRGTEFTFYSV